MEYKVSTYVVESLTDEFHFLGNNEGEKIFLKFGMTLDICIFYMT